MLDTDVVVAAMRSPRGGSAELLRKIDEGKATMLLTVALALEYEAICTLPDHRLASGLSAAEAGLYVDTLIEMASRCSRGFAGGLSSATLAMKWCWKRRSTDERT